MTYTNQNLSYALMEQEKEYIKNHLGEGSWVKVHDFSYFKDENREDNIAFHCGLIYNDCVEQVLNNVIDWEIYQDEGFPSCTQYGFSPDSEVVYYRFGQTKAEPLVFIRSYRGFRERHPEISEEFRLFHNLYYDSEKNEFLKFDQSGDTTSIIRFDNNAVFIRLKEIRQFLAIKDAHLVLFFEYIRLSNSDISTLTDEQENDEYRDEHTAYLFKTRNDNDYPPYTSISSIRGKKLIFPYPKSKSDFWPYNETQDRVYQEFIIGETPDGEPITFTCDSNKLANYFGANPDAPNYLTPVHFKRDVLLKYYGDPDKFSVEDSYLRCRDSWGLKMDNHHENIVIVYLGDLGDLPHKEQNYWKLYNIPPQGGLSLTNWVRDFMATPCDPQDKALKFKLRYEQINKHWKAYYNWSLFRKLSPDDHHFWQNLRVPLNNSQYEFDQQILALTKILIDSLNESEIAQNLSTCPSNTKGIKKLSIFLAENSFKNDESGINLLIDIQAIRSTGVAHLKGSQYQKIANKLQISNRNLQNVFSDLLEQATLFLETLISNLETITKNQRDP